MDRTDLVATLKFLMYKNLQEEDFAHKFAAYIRTITFSCDTATVNQQ